MFTPALPTEPGNYWVWFAQDAEPLPAQVWWDTGTTKPNLRIGGTCIPTQDLNWLSRNNPLIQFEPIQPHSGRLSIQEPL